MSKFRQRRVNTWLVDGKHPAQFTKKDLLIELQHFDIIWMQV